MSCFGGNKMINQHISNVRRACLSASALTSFVLLASPAQAIVINDNYTPSQVVDTANITGVGQMVVDLQNGFIGLCTATLINPRTVLFASHCVNENADETAFKPATTYGVANGGSPIAFFFNANNNQTGDSAIGHWLNGNAGGPKYQTDIADNAYNSNFVVYNTNCCTLGVGNNFLQSDIAIAALDTPAVGIPTWTTLFSPLTAPAHATITGYGGNGTGSTGSDGSNIDYKRRVAENIVSVLGSLDEQDEFLFGAPDGLPANLYMMDFNDPKFGTADANVFDFNIFHDTATTKEGITAPGDSGGPLIIDHTFTDASGKPVSTVAGVLSGGDRFYNAQPGASYGTTSFYQPLYLYWDWIVSNNPYKYVGNVAGNGSWTDAAHWQMNLDPAYMTVDASGHLINALPTTPAAGETAQPGFGEVCYFDDCINLATGVVTNPTPPPGPNPSTGSRPFGGMLGQDGFDALVEQYVASQKGQMSSQLVSGGPAVVSDSEFGGDSSSGGAMSNGSGSLLSSQTSAQSAWTNPEGSATVGGELVQGAPGSALGAVPNDTDGDPTTGAPARYYDVTLAAAGTTTLSGATITIDRLTVNGANTQLTIANSGHLTSLIDTTIDAGTMQVDGTYKSAGAITVNAGVLSGNGTITAPTISSVMGIITPGTVGTVGTLTLDSDLTLSSTSTYLADITPDTSDLLKVNGTADIDGFFAGNFAAGTYTFGTKYTVLTSTGTLTGTFSDGLFVNTPAGTLTDLSYDAHDVYLTLAEAPFVWGMSGTGDWNTALNWQYHLVPTAGDVAIFDAGTQTSVSIGAPSAAKSLQFNADAPAYSFAITGSASGPAALTLSDGITEASGNAPHFTVSGTSATDFGLLTFTGAGNAANAAITAGNFGGVSFAGKTDAGSAAVLVAQNGGVFDFTGTTGVANDHKINAGSIAGAGVFNIGANTLTVGALNTSTEVSGLITGTGGLTKTGSGTLTLSGTNDYSGGTTISAGTLQIGAGGTSGIIAGDVTDNAALLFDRSDDGAFDGVISGSGTLTQAGSGDLVLTANNTYSGATMDNRGILTVDGSIKASAVTVGSGAELAGTGTVGTLTAASGSMLAPGTNGTVGTLSVNGSADLQGATTLLIDTSGTAADKLAVSGTLAASGAVIVSNINGYMPHYGDSAVIASAASITGDFTSLTDPLSGVLKATLTTVSGSDDEEVLLKITADSYLTVFTPTSKDQLILATTLDAARASHYGQLSALYNLLDTQSDGALAQSLENLAPDAERSLGLVGQFALANFDDMLTGHLDDIGETPLTGPQTSNFHGDGLMSATGTQRDIRSLGFHVDGTGLQTVLDSMSSYSGKQQPFTQIGQRLADGSGFSSLAANLGDAAASSSAGGAGNTPAGDSWMALPGGMGGFLTGRSLNGDVAIGGGGGRASVEGYLIGGGLDFPVDEHFIAGATIAAGHANANLHAEPASSKTNFVQGGIYGRYDGDDNEFVTGFASMGGESIKTHRTVVIGTSTFDLSGKTDGTSPSVGFTAGKAFLAHSDGMPYTFTPFVGFQYEHIGIDSFTEHGGAPAMSFQDFNNGVPTARIGADLKLMFGLGDLTAMPSVRAALVEGFGSNNGAVEAAFAGVPSTLMSFDNAPRTDTYGELGLGSDFDLSKWLGRSSILTVHYNTDFGRADLDYHGWTAALKVAF